MYTIANKFPDGEQIAASRRGRCIVRLNLVVRSMNVRVPTSSESLGRGEAWALAGVLAAGVIVVLLTLSNRADGFTHAQGPGPAAASEVQYGSR